MRMDINKISTALENMLNKYEIPETKIIGGNEGSLIIEHKGKKFIFSLCDRNFPNKPEGTPVPLYFWRANRRLNEMKNVLLTGNVKDVVGMRARAITPRDGFWNVDRLIVMVVDLVKFFFDEKIVTVFSTKMDNNYLNAIFCTEKGIRISAEIGEIPQGSIPSFMFEIIGRNGVVTNLPVDTQVSQHSIYVSGDGNVKTYTDTDFELFGLSQPEIDCVRFIMSVCSGKDSFEALQKDKSYINDVVIAIINSGEHEEKVKVTFSEGGNKNA